MKFVRQSDPIDYFPLTLSQQDIFYHQLKTPSAPLYNVGGYIRLSGICLNKLQQAHKQLVQSQEIFGLRVCQHATLGVAQYIVDERDTHLALIDFSKHQNPEQEARQWLDTLFASAIEFDDKPLFRAYVLKLDSERFYYVGFAHHLAMDGWGFANWAKSLGQLYQGEQVDAPSGLWSTVSEKDNEYLRGNKYQNDKAYWQSQQLTPSALLPGFYRSQYPPGQAIASKRVVMPIDSKEVGCVTELAKQHKVSVAQVYLGVIASYFALSFEPSEIVFGLPSHNRKNHQQKNMLGVFTSISPLKLVVDISQSFSQNIAAISAKQQKQYRHQRYPIGHIIADGEHQQSLYDLAFNYLKLDSRLSFDGQSADLVYLSHQHEQTPLSLTLWEYGENRDTELQLDFNLGYFTPSEIDDLAQCLHYLLKQVLAAPELPLAEYRYLPQAQYDQLLSLGQGQFKACQASDVVAMFAAQAKAQPQAIAVIADGRQLTYAELDNAATAVAMRIANQSNGANCRVGVCLTRRVELIVAIMAVLKTGGAYVPLDPNYPKARLAHMIDDAGLALVLSESALSDSLDWPAGVEVLCLEQMASMPNAPAQLATRPIKADDTAYIIYTSGSTGKPKGVCCTHGALVNLLADFQSRRPLGANDKGALWTSTSFDVSVYEIFSALCYGASLNLVPEPIRADTQQLFEWLKQQQISSAFLPGFTLNPLAQWLSQATNQLALKRLLVGVEPIFPKTLARIHQSLESATIINGYGPSEATVCSTLFELDADSAQYHQYVPIGKPVNNAQLYILDEQLSMLPRGMVGELYIGGAGLAQGYLNQTELTAQRFVSSPFSDDPNERLYRSGDLVRWLPDGNIAFIGRNDTQVKIRGFRVELEEIESQLAAFAMVEDVVVVLRQGNEGINDSRLLAYFTCSDMALFSQGNGLTALRAHMRKRLPTHMVPAAFIPLAALPLSPNGKIDKNALPEPSSHQLSDDWVKAETATEHAIAAVCGQILAIDSEKVSMSENFFGLGGDSLKVIKLQQAINQRLGCELSVEAIFNADSLAQLAATIDAGAEQTDHLTVTTRLTQKDEAPLSKNQQRLWFIDQFEGGSAQYNMPGGFEVTGPFDVTIAQQALELVVERHEILRSTYRADEKNPQGVRQVIHNKVEVPLRQIDLSGFSKDKKQQNIANITQQYRNHVFDLANDLLLMACFIKLDNNRGILLFTLHHIAFDGWSVGVLLQEFSANYARLSSNAGQALPPLPIQYGDFALWQQSHLQAEQLREPLAYWQQQLADMPKVHCLPLDRPRPLVKTYAGEQVVATVDTTLTQRLDALAQHYGVTPFILLHSLLALVLSRHSNEQDIVIGTVVANRQQAQVQPLIGFFANTLVLRTNSAGHEYFSDFVEQVKTVNLQAHNAQQVPFEYLVEQLGIARDTSHTPLFQILLSMAVEQSPVPQIAGLQFTPLPEQAPAAKFDLNLNISKVNKGYCLQWIYDSALFDEASIETLNRHFCHLAQQLVDKPHAKMAELNLLSSLEIRQQLQLGQSPSQIELSPQPLHRLIEQQAQTRPSQAAVVCEGKTLSYGELNVASNKLARLLVASNLCPGATVGICYPRSLDMIVAMVALHKAGCAFVPIDLNYPKARIEHMLSDSAMSHVLSATPSMAQFDGAQNLNIIDMSSSRVQAQLAELDGHHFSCGGDDALKALAYVIYTSGSTGKPKGVACYHQSLLNLLLDFNQRAPIGANQQCALWTNVSFDVAMYEIFSALCFGATLHVIPDSVRTDTAKLFDFLQQHQINSCYLPGFALAPLKAFIGENPDAIKLKRLLVGVEPIDHQLLFELQQGVDALHIINGYGPSETTVCSTLYDVDAPINNPTSAVPIGKAVANTQLLVLNEYRQLCPVGSVGELYIGGACVAAGYLHQPELTAERFVQNPYDLTCEIIYRTGDLVRWDKLGNLHFVGRVDNQVKLRGQRIELGEIEQQLSQLEGIDSALVEVVHKGTNGAFLAAYVVCHSGATAQVDAQWLRGQLLELLPLHMVPSAYVVLADWPRTVNGKIDRKALPQPNNMADSKAPLTTGSEKLLAQLWAQALNVELELIGGNSEYFSLGGNSLSAVKLLAAINDKFATELTIKQLFMHSELSRLAQLIDETRQSVKEAGPVALSADEQTFELSSAQQRLWFIDQMKEGSSEYHMFVAFDVDGPLDVRVAEQALQAIIDKHQPLRTVFKANHNDSIAAEVIQQLLPASDFAIDVVSLSGADDGAQHRDRLLSAHSSKAFDLSNDFMLRCLYIGLADNRGLLSFCLHHIAADGWSIGILVNEFSRLYTHIKGNHIKAGEMPALEPLAINYSDYASWQNRWLASEDYQHQLSYWQKQLGGAPLTHELNLRQTRAQTPEHQAGFYQDLLPEPLVKQLQQLAGANGMTLFMLLHGAFALMVSRHSNAKDIVVGTTVANRRFSSLQSMIGLFINALALRVSTEQPTLNAYLAHLKTVNIDALANQDVPFEALVETLNLPRDSRYAPLFQLMITLDMDSAVTPELTGLALTQLPEVKPAVLFDIDLVLRQTEGGMALCWYYDKQLFSASRISEFSAHMQQLLSAFVDSRNLEVAPAKLDMLRPEETARLLTPAKLTKAECEQQPLPHQMFEAHVQNRPQATALSLGDSQLSFFELNQNANRLARLLQAKGVVAGDYVGVCLARSVALIESVLAILKLGGVFVPLDPNYPSARLSFMVSDTNMKHILCADTLPMDCGDGVEVIALASEQCALELGTFDDTNLSVLPQPFDALAYVIYTSGSTGTPKGVMVSLGNWLSYHQAAMALYQTDVNDRIMQFCSISFDVFIEELSLSLLSGATLVIPQDDSVLDGDGFWRWVTQQQITIATLPTAFWHHLCGKAELSKVADDIKLRLIATGGEAMQPGILRNWQQWQQHREQKITLLNMYGPTEATIVVTECDMAKVALGQGNDSALPIGRALDNAQLIVLDEHQQLLPFGATGELYIGGGSIAKGYLNRPELTAKAFVANPLNGDGNDIWYRTGDLVRFNDQDQLLFLGRIDTQVKLRGYRIELGEIEAALVNMASVESALALVYQRQDTPAQLVAYVKGSVQEVDIALLKQQLAGQLPQHMVPTAIVAIEQWPLSPNGKIDKNALPAPSDEQHQDYVAPRNEIEQQLQLIWAQLLGLECDAVGIEHNFFDLGGHSLLATRLINRIEQQFAQRLALKLVFSHSTIAEQASLIAENNAQPNTALTIAVQPPEKTKVLSAQQQRLWLLQQLGKNSAAAYNMYQAFDIEGPLQQTLLQQALDIIVTRHQVLSTSYQLKGAEVVLETNPQAAINLELVDLIAENCALDKHLELERNRVFDLSQAPLMAMKLYRLGEHQFVLMMCVHHIIADGWSVALFVNELMQSYNALLQGRAPQLPELSIQYSDYSHWQAQQLAQDSPEQQYWLAQLQNIAQCHNLPLDKPRPLQQSFVGALHEQRLNSALTQKLGEFAKRHQVTLFMLMQTAFAALVARYSQTCDIAMGTPVANREQGQTEHLLGCFVNTLVLRTEVDLSRSFSEVLADNKTTILAAFDHQSYPFERLVEQLKVERSTAFSPLFQILFVMHNNDNPSLSFDGLAVSAKALEHTMAKFDLSLNVEPLDEQMTLAWEYNVDLFEAQTIQTMGQCFEQLLRAIVTSPEQALERLPLMVQTAQTEPAELAISCNPVEFDSSVGVHQLVERQAQNQPDKTAIVDGKGQLSYQKLNAKANQLAGYFIEQGIAPGQRVGVMLNHQSDTMVCLLALMKISACYVPLDVNISELRLADIAKDAAIDTYIVPFVVHSERALSGKVIALDSLHLDGFSQANLALEHNGDNSVYILFTSGSTGKPKGVEIRHSALCNFLLAMAKKPGFGGDDTLLAVTPLTFDISGLELYLPLICGGTLVLDDSGLTQAVKRLETRMAELNVTVMQATPTMWRMLLDGGWQGKSDLKMLCGGEAITEELAEKLLSKGSELWNMYGPTETTIWSSCGQLQAPATPSQKLKVHIGQAIDNTELYILDKALNPVPQGVPGELYIGGAGLAKGYLNRAELTAQQFIDNPFDSASGPIYATGDLARVDSRGQILHLGRLDHQIKLRGFRIEPGDIESALNAHENISDALVMVYEKDGRADLVAYYVVKDASKGLDNAELRAHLSQRVPDYMLPSIFMNIEGFSLTSSGKKDRKALPTPRQQRAQLARDYVAPATELQGFIVDALKTLVHIDKLGIDDNFFDIGATSLDMVKLAAMLSEHVGFDISPVDLFNHANVRALAEFAKQPQQKMARSEKQTEQLAKAKDRLKNRRKRKA